MNAVFQRVRFAMATKLPHLPDVERISPRVIRILAGNAGKFTLQGTNTYLVGSGPRRILIDTGEGRREWLANLKKTLAEENATLDTVILTHWHRDHTGGIESLSELKMEPKLHKNAPSPGMSDIADGQKFTVDGATLRAFHSPGHTTDHMALVLEEEDAMFTGDNILGHGTAVFEDLKSYLDSLERMSQQVSGRGYPGHGAVIEDCKARAKEYIAHRAQREREVVEILGRGGADGESLTLMGLVKIIYHNVPESLHLPASHGISQILKKLEDEGKATFSDEDDTWVLQNKSAL